MKLHQQSRACREGGIQVDYIRDPPFYSFLITYPRILKFLSQHMSFIWCARPLFCNLGKVLCSKRELWASGLSRVA